MKKTLLALSLIAGLTACSNDNNESSQQQTSKSDKNSTHLQSNQQSSQRSQNKPQSDHASTSGVSYIIGYDLGQNFHRSGADINPDQLMAGIKAGANQKQPKYSKEQMQQAMQQFQQEMQQKAETKQQAQQKQTMDLILESQQQLIDNPDTPYTGPENASVAVVEFFDYQCAFCTLVAPAVEAAAEDNPNVKFVFKDYPIFGQRWSESYYAADVGLIAYQQGGSQMYQAYHHAIFSNEKDEGKLTQDDVDQAAENAGVDLDKASKDQLGTTPQSLPKPILESAQLGHKLGFEGTPAIIVMPTKGASEENTTIFFGYPANPEAGTEAAEKAINQAIEKAQPQNNNSAS